MQLRELVDEVLRKIGRNMMLFQQLEHLLKYVVANGNISGYSRELEDIKTKQASTVSKQTMGQLVGQFLENTHPECEADFIEPEVVKDMHISFKFRIETDSEHYAAKKEVLAKLVEE
jgi:hypothetical protein